MTQANDGSDGIDLSGADGGLDPYALGDLDAGAFAGAFTGVQPDFGVYGVDAGTQESIDALQNLNYATLQSVDPSTLQSVDPSTLQSVDPSTLQSVDPSTPPELDPYATLAFNAGWSGFRSLFTPLDASGQPLVGPLQLYAGLDAKLPALNAAQAYGYTLADSEYFAVPVAAEAAARTTLGIPTGNLPQDIYLSTWGPPSQNAVIDAMLGGGYANVNNPLNDIPSSSVLDLFELPTLRALGLSMGALDVVRGEGQIVAGTQLDVPAPLGDFAVVGGATQTVGGAAFMTGAYMGDAAIMAEASTVAAIGGYVAIVPSAAYEAYQGLQYGAAYVGTWPQSIVDLYMSPGLP